MVSLYDWLQPGRCRRPPSDCITYRSRAKTFRVEIDQDTGANTHACTRTRTHARTQAHTQVHAQTYLVRRHRHRQRKKVCGRLILLETSSWLKMERQIQTGR